MSGAQDRVLEALERRFQSLEALNEWWGYQIGSAQTEIERGEYRVGRELARALHAERAASEESATMATLPSAPEPLPRPFLPDANDDERAARLYGPSLTATSKVALDPSPPTVTGPTFKSIDDIEKHYGRAIKAAGNDPEKVRALRIEEQQAKADFLEAVERAREEALAAAAAQDDAARRLYGEPAFGFGFGAIPHQSRPPAQHEASKEDT